MAGHDVVVSVQAIKKRRRVHPVRRVARLVIKACSSRPSGHPGAEQHTCRGPSFFHNLLPVLEPFFTFDPKLLFIEDHILGRKQALSNADSFQVPSTLEELRSWIEKAAAPCDCDECAPELYQLGERSSHGTIRYQSHSLSNGRLPRFSHVHESPSGPLPELSLRFYGEYEAMRLVRHHVAWLESTYLHNTSSKDDAPPVLQLKSLLKTWEPHLSSPDLRQSLSAAQLQHLFTHLNHIFFFNAIPPHRRAFSTGFSWLPESSQNCFAIASFNPLIGTQILLHPILYRHNNAPADVNVRWRNRLGTLLHELCHAFLKAYTCRACPMHDHCVGARGHGRAWQVLVNAVEKVASRLMGGYVDMGRFASILHDFEGNGKLPSRHDLEIYGLGDGRREREKVA
ncbi:uncharacterized protein K460DRAFT_274570 [Cucurbitaria berberidis CBS 394.84]|uniref:SprT-like domain-containing protein n=1 Tax=Cucurbitaria berberidis CBS 394.84 TaxID=1168544 RepID=A0A9P4GTK4_9PLEO|nr:uncharacterized protein K460DRAFT_274570 [Cucurbitaria berberidis CBS 394.84]KAF1851279.1 hypothetical protein K460DRAFT_274570 [Cucurbitaria berberidis CBS 394.84]